MPTPKPQNPDGIHDKLNKINEESTSIVAVKPVCGKHDAFRKREAKLVGGA